MAKNVSILLLPALLALLEPESALANDRKLTYVYETSVLPFGARELEVWNTYRSNRGYFYREIDQRLEFEFGIGCNIMSALYLNHSWIQRDAAAPPGGGNAVTTSSVSISNEWKFKLADRVADPVGLGLYAEATAGLDEFELEGKLLLDKQMGRWLVAFNASAEHAWETELATGSTHTTSELTVELAGGVAYELKHGTSIGLEFRNHNDIVAGTWEHSAFFAGPVISYSTEGWWATLTILPQVTSFKGATDGALVLDGHEKVEARLLFSFHL